MRLAEAGAGDLEGGDRGAEVLGGEVLGCGGQRQTVGEGPGPERSRPAENSLPLCSCFFSPQRLHRRKMADPRAEHRAGRANPGSDRWRWLPNRTRGKLILKRKEIALKSRTPLGR